MLANKQKNFWMSIFINLELQFQNYEITSLIIFGLMINRLS